MKPTYLYMLLFVLFPTVTYSQGHSPADSAMQRSIQDSSYSLPSDTTSIKDSIAAKKQEIFKIKGSVTVTGMLSDQKMLNQFIPSNYLRTYVNSEIEIGGLPFSASYYVTTENDGNNPINNFRLSFRYDKLYQQIKQKMSDKLNKNKQEELDQLNRFNIDKVNKDYSKIQDLLTSPGYQKQFKTNQKILDIGARDSTFRKTHKYQKALKQQADHETYVSELKRLSELKESALKNSNKANVNAVVKDIDVSRPSGFSKQAKRHGVANSAQQLFLSVKKLDIGTFDPAYTSLVLNGVSVTGINAEVNPGNVYGAFTLGKVVSTFTTPSSFSALSGGRDILAGRLGIGRTEKFLMAISLLKGADESGNVVRDSFYNYNLPSNNYVVGLDITYKLNKEFETGFEYAKSSNEQNSEHNKAASSQFSSLIATKSENHTSAWLAYLKASFGNTKIVLSVRKVDPFYYSFGTPFLRRDNFRTELKAEQMFWKKQLTTGFTYRRDADNLYDLKPGTSVNNTMIFHIQLKIKKYPYLLLTYSPNQHMYYHSVLSKRMNAQVNVYNIIVGYIYQTSSITSHTNVSFTSQEQYGYPEQKKTKVMQYGANENIHFRNIHFSINAGMNLITSLDRSDTGMVTTMFIDATKGVFKNTIKISGGYRYQKDFWIAERNVLSAGAGFKMGWNIVVNVIAEKHFIRSMTELIPYKNMNMGRITMIKTF